jgi:hypothetical protein
MLHQDLIGYPASTGVEPKASQAKSDNADIEKGSGDNA